jgi:hypothetical protein
MNIGERLQDLLDKGEPIGFSPWRDAEGALWGIVLRKSKSKFTVREISPTGTDEGEKTYNIASVSYFQEDATYSERLKRLSNFHPTKPAGESFVRLRFTVKSHLIEAAGTREVLRVKLRGETDSRSVCVQWCDGTWSELIVYDYLMSEVERMIWRVSAIEGVRRRTMAEEADEFLMAMANV